MNVQYLLLARYRAIADKNNYIVWEFVGTSESFTDAMAHLATLRLLGIEIDEDIISYAKARLLDADILKIEADADAYATKIQAEAKAEANADIANSVTELLVKYIEASNWDGKLPEIYSGSGELIPVINNAGEVGGAE